MKQRWRRAFLANLRQSGSVTEAASAAKISRTIVYQNKREDPIFAHEWDEALDMAADELERIAINRAKEGTSKGSDTLLMFLLKGLRPQKFRESRATVPPAELNKMIEAELARIARQNETEQLLLTEKALPN